MKLCIDWEAIHQDWQASGLSKNRYFLSGRIEKFIREGVAPCYSTFLHPLRVLEKGQAISQESSACESTPARNNRTQTRIQGSPLAQEYEKYEML